MAAGGKQTKKTRKTKGSSAPSLNVRSAKDITSALNILKKAPVALILVYANWCPHCHTYMPMWEKIAKTPGRNVPMIATEQTTADEIMSNVYNNGTPMKVEGFPTVIAVRNSPNGQTIGVEVPNSRNEVAMTNMVKNSSELGATVASVTAPAVGDNRPSSPIRTANMANLGMNAAVPETLGEDVYLAKEQTPENIAATMEMPPVNEDIGMRASNSEPVRVGGSLYESLAAIANPATATAAGLLLANEMLKRRGTRVTRRLLKSRGRRAFFRKSRKVGRKVGRKASRKGRK
jgi:thiol-disulfide isomerase/thioredoxin